VPVLTVTAHTKWVSWELTPTKIANLFTQLWLLLYPSTSLSRLDHTVVGPSSRTSGSLASVQRRSVARNRTSLKSRSMERTTTQLMTSQMLCSLMSKMLHLRISSTHQKVGPTLVTAVSGLAQHPRMLYLLSTTSNTLESHHQKPIQHSKWLVTLRLPQVPIKVATRKKIGMHGSARIQDWVFYYLSLLMQTPRTDLSSQLKSPAKRPATTTN